jgi:hypothetical protein
MYQKLKYASLIFTVVLSSAQAQTNVGGADSAATDNAGRLQVSGYFDTYYFTNLNKPSNRNNLGSSGVSRGFDRYVDQFQLGMFLTRTSYSNKWGELVGEIGYGPNVEYGSYGNDVRYKWGTVIANSTYTALLIKQAYINFKATEKLTFTAGQFGTHIGYEYIDAPLNFHYSINNTFNVGIPFYHIGLKGTYQIGEKVALMCGLVNGTDNMNDNNRGKSFIGQLALTPAEGLSVYLNTIQGNEANTRSNGQDTASYFGVLDFVSTYQVSERFMIGVWAMHGSLKGEYQGGTYFPQTRHWSGVNLYTTFKCSEIFSIGTRFEYFENKSGVRALLTDGKGTDVATVTVTGNVSLAGDHLFLKPEFRIDKFRKISRTATEQALQQFMDSDGQFTRSSQSTIGLAAIYKF